VVFDPACLLPHAFRGAVREALLLGAQAGPQLGFPLVQARVRVLRCETRPGAEAEMAYAQVAAMALREALEAARVELLEPLMAFEIQTPPEFVSGVIADLNARRAEVEGVGVEGTLREVSGRVPLGQMFGYATAVRSLSQGRASFSMLPAGYRAVPADELAERGLTWG
jgi:elongation factor G